MVPFRPSSLLFVGTRSGPPSEDVGVLSIDKTSDGVALKFSERRACITRKLAACVEQSRGPSFHAHRCLRLNLSEDEQEQVIDVVRGVLMELRQ